MLHGSQTASAAHIGPCLLPAASYCIVPSGYVWLGYTCCVALILMHTCRLSVRQPAAYVLPGEALATLTNISNPYERKLRSHLSFSHVALLAGFRPQRVGPALDCGLPTQCQGPTTTLNQVTAAHTATLKHSSVIVMTSETCNEHAPTALVLTILIRMASRQYRWLPYLLTTWPCSRVSRVLQTPLKLCAA